MKTIEQLKTEDPELHETLSKAADAMIAACKESAGKPSRIETRIPQDVLDGAGLTKPPKG
jgi:hypothetical protein